ncbi:MAG: SAM-dependent methyltransferase [Treponema sp.]|nr:SAM-dependent methyltransferase [Treponema sp.]
MEQKHLNVERTVNQGSFYTPPHLVDMVYDLINSHVNRIEDYIIVDTSCGYGSMLRGARTVGSDIDCVALRQAALNNPHIDLFHFNGLSHVKRDNYHIRNSDNIIIVGNPPYNDKTSLIKHTIKQHNYVIDDGLKTRDLGLSFLLSYNTLRADYICVLHPLSYLIKKTNFHALKAFTDHYILKDSIIISSNEFPQLSKKTHFPIIIAFYERCTSGMDYRFIEQYTFHTIDKKTWQLKHFDTVDNYILKYPNAKKVPLEDTVTFFWTLRDINALKRNKTFVDKESSTTVRVRPEQFAYYCYVDIFKEYIHHIPYYFGNCNICIENETFNAIKHIFIQKACAKYRFLAHCAQKPAAEYAGLLDAYFQALMGEHYVY